MLVMKNVYRSIDNVKIASLSEIVDEMFPLVNEPTHKAEVTEEMKLQCDRPQSLWQRSVPSLWSHDGRILQDSLKTKQCTATAQRSWSLCEQWFKNQHGNVIWDTLYILYIMADVALWHLLDVQNDENTHCKCKFNKATKNHFFINFKGVYQYFVFKYVFKGFGFDKNVCN